MYLNSQQPTNKVTKIKSINTVQVQTNMKAVGDIKYYCKTT